MKSKRQAGMLFILITLFIDILGIGIIIPVLPKLVEHFVGGGESDAARTYGLIVALYALMQFFFAPVLGALSDRYGRRTVLLISLFGLGVDYLIQTFAPSLGWLVLGRLIAGIGGASITTANAYIADVSTPETRARNYGLVGVAFGLGFIFGPALGGVLGHYHLRLPFLVAALLAFANWLYGFFVLPESLPKAERSPFEWRKTNPLSSMALLRRSPLVAGLALSYLLAAFAQRGLETVWVLHNSYRYGWGEMQNGLSLMLVGVVAALVQGGLVRPMVKRLGERRTVLVGLTAGTLSFLGYAFAVNGKILLAVILLSGFAGLTNPAIQGLVAGVVPGRDQGKVQGALTSLMSLSSIFAPIIFATGIFSAFTAATAPVKLPGAPFFLGALLLLVALALNVRLFKRLPEDASA